jgi:beta-lactamase superfamily II metal-dependent hydrolase
MKTATLRCVQKVGQHGSKNFDDAGILAAVHLPVRGISPAEENPYGHPKPELLKRLATAGVRICGQTATAQVLILTDGNHLEVNCFVACPETFGSTAPAQAQTATSRGATRAKAKNR